MQEYFILVSLKINIKLIFMKFDTFTGIPMKVYLFSHKQYI